METGKRKSSLLMSQINVTPFVDVMLVLLIIFMVTAPMMQTGLDVNLPKVEAAAVNSQDKARIPERTAVQAQGTDGKACGHSR